MEEDDYYRGETYCRGDITTEEGYCGRGGTETLEVTADKVCRHLETWGKGGFSVKGSKCKHRGPDVGLA